MGKAGAKTSVTRRRAGVGSTGSTRARSSAHRSVTSTGYLPDRRTEFVVNILGNQGAADLLEVNKSQPSRWRSGEESPSPTVARRLIDLDYVLGRLLLVWDKSVAADWLTTPNGFLDGATPIEVIEARGTTDVIDAIEAEGAEAYV
jgi:uncharacterized protein (DUF2384 family)